MGDPGIVTTSTHTLPARSQTGSSKGSILFASSERSTVTMPNGAGCDHSCLSMRAAGGTSCGLHSRRAIGNAKWLRTVPSALLALCTLHIFLSGVFVLPPSSAISASDTSVW
eukprot:3183788-Rhodomonas_salina.1